MTPRPPRRLTILDGMILVAAMALGLAMRRAMAGAFVGGYGSGNWLGRHTEEALWAALPFLLAMTPAVLAMRLRRPRPRWRRLARQPGTAACCAAAVPIGLALARFAAALRGQAPSSSGFGGDWLSTPFVFMDDATRAGLWVLAAWLALGLSGRRRAERGGVDQLGRIVGLGWIVLLAIWTLGAS